MFDWYSGYSSYSRSSIEVGQMVYSSGSQTNFCNLMTLIFYVVYIILYSQPHTIYHTRK